MRKGMAGQPAMSAAGLAYFICCRLLDAEFQLSEIDRARAARNFTALAGHAHRLADIAAEMGAPRTAAAARRLAQSSRAGDPRQTDCLTDALRQSAAQSDRALRGVVAAARGGAD
jgi:HPt (histidine-containing phosphotransfer) domain-containing protein